MTDAPVSVVPENFVVDVDGVLTDGGFYYSAEGLMLKKFCADDVDALRVLAGYLNIQFVSADRRSFEISRKRVLEDMGFPIELINTHSRLEWLKARYDLSKVIYMADGFFDAWIFKQVGYSIAPAGSDSMTEKVASHVTRRRGGDRAVAEACVHILEKFFGYDREAALSLPSGDFRRPRQT